jgi:hypothetical protein
MSERRLIRTAPLRAPLESRNDAASIHSAPMIRRLAIVLVALATLCGCASTRIVNQWESPEPGAPFRKVLVVAMLDNQSVRRTFEDEFVRALMARGVAAVPSYTVIPESGRVPEGRLDAAVKQTGADGVVSTRVVRVNQEVDVIPAAPPMYWGPPWGFRGWYGSAWGPAYAYPPQVVTRDVVYAEVRLYRAASDALVWAATTQTFAPGDARKESAAFADLILRQFAERKLI